MFAIMLFGMVGFSRLAVKLLPDLSYPSVTIRTMYDGAAPVEVEQLISKPIEEAVGVVKGLRRIHSVSKSGLSDVVLEFEWGTDMDMASLDVREKLDTVVLPLEISKPLLLRFNPNLDPIVRIAMSTEQEQSLEDLKHMRTYADEQLKRKIEAVKGVAQVQLSGGLERQIEITLDQYRLTQLGLTSDHILKRISAENVNVSAGKVLEGEKEYLVRTFNQFLTLDSLGQLIVYRDANTMVRLFEVATIKNGNKEQQDVVRVNGQPAVELAIYKEGDSNTVQVADAIKQAVEQINKDKEVQLTVIFDQSTFIKQAVNEVTSAGLLGSLLAMLVIYLFLKDIVATLIISIAIPVSIVATFNLMYFSGISLNIMSLGGIALAVGLLVDNAIVVLENIDKYKQQGLTKLDAAVKGSQEVASAIFASTLTTLAVFVPLIFVDGIAGSLFSDQAMTVTFSLIASLVVALTVIPMLASRQGFQALPALIKPKKKLPDSKLGKLKHYSATVFSFPFIVLFKQLPQLLLTSIMALFRVFSFILGKLFWPIKTLFNFVYRGIEKAYQPLLKGALKRPLVTTLVAVAISAIIFMQLPKLGQELIPQMAQGEFYAEVLLPPGTDVKRTDEVLETLRLAIAEHPSVTSIYAQAGSAGLLTSQGNKGGEHWGRLQVNLSSANSYQAVAGLLRTQGAKISDLELNIEHPQLFSFKTPLEIELQSYDLVQLRQASEQVLAALDNNPRFSDLQNSMRDGQPELLIEFDHPRLAALGLEAPEIARAIATRVGGNVASKYTVRDRKIDIEVRSQIDERNEASDISQMIINPNSTRPISLGSVAFISYQVGPAAIDRVDQQRVAIISSNLGFGTLDEAAAEAEQIINNLNLSKGVLTRVVGQNEEMQHSFNSLKMALALAVFLVYVVMASQFESFVQPLVILGAVPMALAGAILGLMLTNTPLSVVVFIGVIMLAGIVVNNAIVLTDRMNQLLNQGEQLRDAIYQAATSRLRPIMMTTFTTTLGLLPMAIGIGEGAEVRAPMAITVIFGLTLATLLTLVVIPALLSMVSKNSTAAEVSHA